MFRKADAVQPGAFDILSKKGLQILGPPCEDGDPLSVLGALQEGKADVVVAYCSYGIHLPETLPGATSQPFPAMLDVRSQYGIGATVGSPSQATQFIQLIRGKAGQSILNLYGFGQ